MRIDKTLNSFCDLKISTTEKEIISQEAPSAEKLGKLTNAQLDVIYRNRWFHLLVPKSLGGNEMALPEFARFMETLAIIDGSFAWNVNLGVGANMFAGFMDQSIAAEIFSSERCCVAGSGAVGGTAKKQDGGYSINGDWNYASGSAHATYFSLNARLIDKEENEFASFLVAAKDVEVLDTWNVFGMKATSSCNFNVKDVWIPENYLFNLQKPSPIIDSALYRFPFMLLAEINMLVMVSGLAIRFYELIMGLAKNKILSSKNMKIGARLIEDPEFNKVLPKIEALFFEKRAVTFDLLDEAWTIVETNQIIPYALSANFSKSVAETAKASRLLVDALYPFAGMGVVFQDSELSRVFRDFKVASQHTLLSPTVRI